MSTTPKQTHGQTATPRPKVLIVDDLPESPGIACAHLAAECASLREENERLKASLGGADSLLQRYREVVQCCADPNGGELRLAPERVMNHVTALRSEVATLKETLHFYATSDNYCRPFIPGARDDDPRTFAPVLQDGGDKANRALTGAQGERT